MSDSLRPHESPPSSGYGILYSRILEWVAMPISRGSSQPRDWTCVSYISCILHHLQTGSLYSASEVKIISLF